MKEQVAKLTCDCGATIEVRVLTEYPTTVEELDAVALKIGKVVVDHVMAKH